MGSYPKDGFSARDWSLAPLSSQSTRQQTAAAAPSVTDAKLCRAEASSDQAIEE